MEYKLKNRCSHHVKIDTESFKHIRDGLRTFDIRFNDNDFKVVDDIIFHEIDLSSIELEETGNTLTKKVSYIINGGVYGIPKGYVIMSIL